MTTRRDNQTRPKGLSLRRQAGSAAHRARGIEKAVPFAFAAAAALLGLGVLLPIVTVKQLFVFSDRFSILQAIGELYEAGEIVLATVLVLFSVVFPAMKILLAAHVWRHCPAEDARTGRRLALLDWIGRWSMLDVLGVGLVVFSVKASSVASATSEPGMYCFFGAVASSAVAVGLLKRTVARARLDQ